MNDDVSFSIRQMAGAWRMMCAGGPHREFQTTTLLELDPAAAESDEQLAAA